MSSPELHLRHAVELARENAARGGRPFGAVLVRDGAVLATGVNEIGRTGDPTTHAELQAIRAACRLLNATRLDGCEIYASGQPCPMCLAAMYLTGVSALYFRHANAAGEPFGLSTAAVYAELQKPLDQQSLPIVHLPGDIDDGLYREWYAAQSKG